MTLVLLPEAGRPMIPKLPTRLSPWQTTAGASHLPPPRSPPPRSPPSRSPPPQPKDSNRHSWAKTVDHNTKAGERQHIVPPGDKSKVVPPSERLKIVLLDDKHKSSPSGERQNKTPCGERDSPFGEGTLSNEVWTNTTASKNIYKNTFPAVGKRPHSALINKTHATPSNEKSHPAPPNVKSTPPSQRPPMALPCGMKIPELPKKIPELPKKIPELPKKTISYNHSKQI